MLKNPNNCHYKSSLDVAATNQAILADGLISFDIINTNTGVSIDYSTGKVVTLKQPGLYHVDLQATVAPTAAGSAVSLTTAADIYIPCCGVPATISAQIDVAGTVVSATMVVTKMA